MSRARAQATRLLALTLTKPMQTPSLSLSSSLQPLSHLSTHHHHRYQQQQQQNNYTTTPSPPNNPLSPSKIKIPTPTSTTTITHASLLDRHLLNPSHAESTQSGTDDSAAHHLSSYDPLITDPAAEVRASEEECRRLRELDDPLYVSPGNREVSRLMDPMVGGAVHGAARAGPSGRGWTRKGRVVRVRGGVKGRWDWGRWERVLRDLRGEVKDGGGEKGMV